VALRTAAVYLVILAGLRLSGKREMGQLTVFDLVVLLLLASAVQYAMIGADTSLAGGIVAALVPLPLSLVAILVAIALAYMTCSEAVKRAFYRRADE
jgi:uncharacterized membrane protein YcaP (DUF421 family)